MAAPLESYRAAAEAYSAGARALFTGSPAAGSLERAAAASFSPAGLAEQGSQLAPVSEQFTAAAAVLLEDPDPQVRADASAQMLAKALVDLQISAHFLEAAEFAENPAGQSFSVERSAERAAAAASVEDALTV